MASWLAERPIKKRARQFLALFFFKKISYDKSKDMKKIFLVVFIFLFLILGQVQAAGLVPCGGHIYDNAGNIVGEEPDCTLCHFFVMFNNIVKFVMFNLVPVIAVLMLMVGGVMFFFAGAQPSILIQAKGIITSVVIGLVIVFSAWVIVNTIMTKIGIVNSPSLLNWYNIECSTQ